MRIILAMSALAFCSLCFDHAHADGPKPPCEPLPVLRATTLFRGVGKRNVDYDYRLYVKSLSQPFSFSSCTAKSWPRLLTRA